MKKEFLKFGIIFLIIIGVIAWGVNYMFFQNGIGSKATGETMTLSFSPSIVTTSANLNFNVSVIAKSSDASGPIVSQLRGYKTRVSFDKTKVAFKSIEYKVGVVSPDLGNTTANASVINGNGYIDIVGQDTTAVGTSITTANGAELVSITFTALSTAPNLITTNNNDFYTLNPGGFLFSTWAYVDGNLSLNGAPTATPVYSPTPTPIPVVCTSFSDDFTGTTSTGFDDDFSGTSLNTGKWGVWNNGGTQISIANGQATFHIPQATEDKQSDIFSTNPISGDFSVEVTLKDHSTVDNKLTSNLILSVFNAGWLQYISILKPYNKGPGELAIVWKEGNDKSEGINDGIDHNTPVKVKIERMGSTFKMYYDKLDGSGYKLLKQIDNYYIGPMNYQVTLGNYAPDYPEATATFDDFKLTQGPQIDGSKWGWIPPATASTSATLSGGKLIETDISQLSGWSGLSVGSKQSFSGDYDLTEDLQVNQAGANNKGQTWLTLTNVNWKNQLTIGLKSNGDLYANTDLNDQWGTEFLKTGLSQPVTVKINKTGDTVKFYYKNGTDFTLLGQRSGIYTGEMFINNGTGNGRLESEPVDIHTSSFDNFNLTCAASTVTPSPTPTGVVGGGNVNLKLKLKFQAIGQLPANGQNSMVVKAKVYKEGETTPIDGTGTFVSDGTGIWSGTIPVNISSLTGKFRILLKGSHHIQKKVCDATPTESPLGTYRCSTGNISLVAGDNDLNFSGIALLAGDLDQSGIVDSVDFGLVRNNLGKTDSATLTRADLNRDGIVDTQDFAMILVALGKRTDEQ